MAGRTGGTWAAVLVALIALGAPASAVASKVKVSAASTRAEYVSGGDVLVRIDATGTVRVERDRTDVTSAFHRMPDGSLLGLVDGLSPGRHAIVAREPRGRHGGRSGRLTVVDHPITGPLFSGPQQQPFFCETAAAGLGPPQDDACSAPTQVSYVYRSTAGAFKPLADPTSRPADLAQTAVGGRTVDYIVRLERGTIDRGIYEIAALFDRAAPPSPFAAEPGWNRSLVYTFGGGCNAGFHQGTSTGGVLNDMMLSRGHAVASSTLNVLDNNCSPVISAEAALMVKEHFIETYGVPTHAIGWGGSGGAIQQYTIADNYPGILDGIVPAISFPDPITVSSTVGDCRLMDRYFATPDAQALGWTSAQRTAVSGFGTFNSCVNWDLSFANRGTATDSCNPAIPPAARWDPVTNPAGVKCSSYEQMVNVLGRNPDTGFAYRPVENFGVQYGLSALRAGTITPEQFVSLNERIGGYDVAGNVVAQRTAADRIGLRRAYAAGLIIDGGLGLARTPIIELRTYTDALGDIHTRYWSFVTRQRLLERNGTFANQVMLLTGLDGASNAAASLEALTQMDAWLTAGRRPSDLSDACWTPAGQKVVEPFSYQGTGTCEGLYPSFGDTRSVAGERLDESALKCRLRPLDFGSYGVSFSADQQARLRAAFPDGVCDYTRPGVDQRRAAGTWQDFTRGP
jgi:uncharacterized tannase-like protein DUF6351